MNDFIVVVIIKRNELGFLILRLFPELLIIILKIMRKLNLQKILIILLLWYQIYIFIYIEIVQN